MAEHMRTLEETRIGDEYLYFVCLDCGARKYERMDKINPLNPRITQGWMRKAMDGGGDATRNWVPAPECEI